MVKVTKVKKEDHKLPPPELELRNTLHEERHAFGEVQVPLVTVSASFRQDVAEYFGEEVQEVEDVVFSRAHFSMAIALFEEAVREDLSSWLVDPTNYVSASDWKKVMFIEKTGKLIARFGVLKKIKDVLDNFLRDQFPLREAIIPPLLYAVGRMRRPVISLHYEVGNILAKNGNFVIQVVTDPHVRPHYLQEAQRPNIFFAVFDENTKNELIEKARLASKGDITKRVFVTGPPVDPRIIDVREKKKPDSFRTRGLHLAITTGGIGTNKPEIKTVLDQIQDKVKKGEVKVILYAGTHKDFALMFEEYALDLNIKLGDLSDKEARIRIIYDPKIIEVNKQLIDHAFPWADGFVTKPSGDMAYDAVGAGCFILSLSPWGEWEERIQKIFSNLSILKEADEEHFGQQLEELSTSGWVGNAIDKAQKIDRLFLNGAKKIIKLQQNLAKDHTRS